VLFPALVLAIWWRPTGRWAVLAGMAAGLLVTAFAFADLLDPAGSALRSLGPVFAPESQLILAPEGFAALAGLFGALANTLVAVAVSRFVPRPDPAGESFSDELWRSHSRPLLHPAETRVHPHRPPRVSEVLP
jgi:Na+/proline symporter